jgi:hypothetical protein
MRRVTLALPAQPGVWEDYPWTEGQFSSVVSQSLRWDWDQSECERMKVAI